MAFRQDGSWVPDQPINRQQGMMQQAGSPQVAPQGMQMNSQQNQPLQHLNYQGFSPNGPPDPGTNYRMRNVNPQQNQGSMTPQGMQGAQGLSMPQSFNQSQQGYTPQYAPPPPPAQSMTQSVNSANPSDVQNFLRALGQAGQSTGFNAAQNNAWRNPYGMQGQQAQAGFQGFGQNGQAQQYSAQQYSAPGSQLGYAQNQATSGGPVTQSQGYAGINGNSNGMGVAYQPQYQQAPTPSNTPGSGPAAPGTYITPQQVLGQFNYSADDYKSAQQGPYHIFQTVPGSGGQPQAPGTPSDIASKQNIKGGDRELQEFLDSLGVYSYEYKDPKYGEGRRISPMAQEIEKTPLGAAAISRNEEGYKTVDYGKLGGTMLAGLALLNHKYDDLKESIMSGLKNKEGKK